MSDSCGAEAVSHGALKQHIPTPIEQISEDFPTQKLSHFSNFRNHYCHACMLYDGNTVELKYLKNLSVATRGRPATRKSSEGVTFQC